MVPEMRPFFATGRTRKNHRGHQKCAIPKVETISPKGRQSAAHLHRKQTNKSKVWVKLVRLCILNASSRGVLQASISMSSARRLCPPNKISTEATVVLSCDYRLVVLSTNSAVTEASSQKMEPYSGPVFGTDFRSLASIFAIVFFQKHSCMANILHKQFLKSQGGQRARRARVTSDDPKTNQRAMHGGRSIREHG